MKIVWSSQSIADLAAARAFIAEDDREAAKRIALRIVDMAETILVENPHIGRSGRVSGTREFVVPKTSFIIPYRVKSGTLHILRVYHASRRWPEKM